MQNIYTRLINEKHPLPSDYIPENLIDAGIPFHAHPDDSKRLLEKNAARAALCLVNAACQQGLCLYGISGYRSYQRQAELYTGSPYVAAPGTSEHQSGLALDLSCPAVHMQLIPEFAHTKEGKWIDSKTLLQYLGDGTLKKYYETQQKKFIDAGDVDKEVPIENYVLFDVMEEAGK
mgnify:CR=1 FL=1